MCCKCKKPVKKVKKNIVINNFCVGEVVIPNADFSECECGEHRQLPVTLCLQADKIAKTIFNNWIIDQPLKDFISSKEACNILKITSRELNKSRGKIRRGFIYYTKFGNYFMYLKKSVELFVKRGNGRFLISVNKKQKQNGNK